MSEHAVDLADAIRRLDIIEDYDAGNGPGACVHTFMQSAIGMLGAHWYLDTLKAHMATHGVERAGEFATSMGHGLVVLEPGRGPLFVATKQEAA